MATEKTFAGNYAETNRAMTIKVWLGIVNQNGGIHAWNSEYDGMYVFQEWVALLSSVRDSSEGVKRRIGRKLEAYVVGGKIAPLSPMGTSLPIPGFSEGDFDMTLISCVTLLGLFERDSVLLTNRTYTHLLQKVMRVWGQNPKDNFDVLFFSYCVSSTN